MITADTVLIKYLVESDQAIRETQKLAAAQQQHAKQTAKAMDDFQKEATSALGKVEKSWQAQAKAARDAAKAAADAPGFLDRAGGALNKFNSVVGLASRTLGAWGMALDLGKTGVELLGAAMGKLGDVFGSKPELRMMWEKDPMRGWIDGLKEAQVEADKWFAKMREIYFGANVDSDHNLTRRRNAAAEAKRLQQQESDNIDYLRERRLEAQKAQAQDKKDRFNHEGAYAPAKRSGGVVRDLQNDHGVLDIARDAVAALAKAAAAHRAANGQRLDAEVARLLRDDRDIGDMTASDALVAEISGRMFKNEGMGFGEKIKSGQGHGKRTVLESLFGTPDDIEMYREAVGGLMDAASSGYTALVTQSESFGKAAKAVIGQTVLAEGAHMFVLALKEGAMAIGSLASGNLAAASGHAIAAAKFGAGAAIAGVVARGLGANEKGGWGGRPEDPRAGVGASASGIGLGGGGNDRPINTTVILGTGYDDESPRQRYERVARMNRKAAGVSPPPRGVSYA